MRIREDTVVRPDGTPGIYGVMEVRPSIGVVALNANEEIVLVGQWRYPHGKYSWEIPRGGSDPGENRMLAAQRELREETGIEAGAWESLGEVDLGNGLANEVESLYLARELTLGTARREPGELLAIRWVPLAEAVEMVMQGEIAEVCSVAAILIAARRRDARG